MTNLDALKELAEAAGATDVDDIDSNLDALNATAKALGGTGESDSNADAFHEIAENFSGGGGESELVKVGTVTVTYSDDDYYIVGGVFESNGVKTAKITVPRNATSIPQKFDVYAPSGETEVYAEVFVQADNYPFTRYITATGNFENIGSASPYYIRRIYGDCSISIDQG